MTSVRTLIAPALMLALSTGATAQATRLRIVVIEGENAVNIIQQGTAVAPVVEVRDRNDQPVAGAVVRFTIQRGRAAFNGARALSVTTDAAGRAAASGFTVTGNGALQIGASTAFQGTSTSVTISQTTVATAAQAAQLPGLSGTSGGTAGAAGAGAAVAGGAAAITGGAGAGLSVTTLAIIGGAAAGGTIAGLQVKDAFFDSDWYDGSFSGTEVIASGTCGTTMRITGTLSIRLKGDDGTLKEGDGTIGGDLTFVSTTCGLGLGSQPTSVPPFTVTGTLSNFAWSSSLTTSNTQTYSFVGSVTGNTITGSLTHTFASAVGASFTGAVTMPVVLTRR